MKRRAPRQHENYATSKPAQDVQAGARALLSGELVVFPTETVYGLGANALNERAVAKIFEAKGRPSDNPLIVHLFERDQLSSVVAHVPDVASALFDAFAPGPLTLVLPVSSSVPSSVTAGLPTVAVRFPRHPVARALLHDAAVPVAAPSANRSGEPSPTTVEMSRESLADWVGVYIDGGPCEVGLESTVAACDKDQVTILRPGAVTAADISRVLPGVRVVEPGAGAEMSLGYGETSADAVAADKSAPASPGLKHRHYQPSVPVYLWQAGESSARPVAGAAARLRSPVLREMLERRNVGVICRRERKLPGTAEAGKVPARLVRRYSNLEEYARMLYFWFYELDRERPEAILAEIPGREGIGIAIVDRLTRASSGVIASRD